MAHKIREVYIVHHSHTDVGYTDLQEQVIYNQANNIRRAVELISEGLEKGTNQKDLKWNCETWYCVEQFLKAATKEEKKIFFDLVKKNRIGLSANYLNFNDLADCEYLTEKIHDMQEVCAKEGITVKTAMFADINGISMGQRDAMLANGVEFLYIQISTPITVCIRCIRTRSLISGKTKTASVCWYGAASITTWATRWASYSTKTSIS